MESNLRRDRLDSFAGVIMPSDEKFICLNCKAIDVLNQQLRCSHCDSDSVVSTSRLTELVSLGGFVVPPKQTRKTLTTKTLYVVKCGPFACTVYADSQVEAVEASKERSWCIDNDQWFASLAKEGEIDVPLSVYAEPVKAQQTLEQTSLL